VKRSERKKEILDGFGVPGEWFLLPKGISVANVYRISPEEAAEAILREEERAGKAWDPEVPKLPERLSVAPICGADDNLHPHLYPEGLLSPESRDQEHAYYSEARRRYNAWAELRRVVSDYTKGIPISGRRLHAILEGHDG